MSLAQKNEKSVPSSEESNLVIDPAKVADALQGADIWIMPQPKAVRINTSSFDLKKCKGIRVEGKASNIQDIIPDTSNLIKDASGIDLKKAKSRVYKDCIVLGVFPDGKLPSKFSKVISGDIKKLGVQGYALSVGSNGIYAASINQEGLHYAMKTISQIASDRDTLPGVYVEDWPSMEYRGVQYDISRGQAPTQESLKELTRVLSAAKMNTLELYIENMIKWKSNPEIAVPEAMSPQEARELFDYAAKNYIEIHPLSQVLGHMDKILGHPDYQHLTVPLPKEGIGDRPWSMTLDIRKPEAIEFITELLNETCDAFPGKFINVDITEIADYGFTMSGTKPEDLPELIFQYVLKLRDIVGKHNMRLMIAQAQLNSTGHLAGIGALIDKLPKDIVISSYYTAEFYGGWDKDFPQMHDLGIDFFAQPWIDSHGRIMPYTGHAKDFSDITVSRGVMHGSIGSTTCDWGDMGHYHLMGTTWYPFLYHGASAWTGAKLDREYFDQAYTRLMFGIKSDEVAKAIDLAGNINGQKMKTRNPAGEVVEYPYTGNLTLGHYYWEFFNDPFNDPFIATVVEPGVKSREIREPADKSVSMLEKALKQAKRNKPNIEELLFAAKNYQAMADKLQIRSNYLDKSYPQEKIKSEANNLITQYESLRNEFIRLWTAENKDNDAYRELLSRFDRTINACKEYIK
ncbi:MAG: glycoside hydrolase family 20 zincin-like fold domain-containing protein [Armatimonadota bacterium]